MSDANGGNAGNGGNGGDQIATRKQAAGRLGFIFGCIAAVGAACVNLYRASGPITLAQAVIFVLMAALNVPLWIALGLLVERLSRPKTDGGK